MTTYSPRRVNSRKHNLVHNLVLGASEVLASALDRGIVTPGRFGAMQVSNLVDPDVAPCALDGRGAYRQLGFPVIGDQG